MSNTAYKPILINIPAFDANVGTTVYFTWKGAQVFQNELIIRDSQTLDIVYKYKTDRNMLLKHEMNLLLGSTNAEVTGNLQNGKQYQATITVFDKYGVQSEASDPLTFWCFSNPTLRIVNEDVLSGIITTSSLYLSFFYSQNEGEILNEYYIELFDETRQLVHSSQVYYGSSSEEYLEYRIEGLLNNHSYYANVHIKTTHGIESETGLVPFSVKYDKMGAGALIYLRDLGNGNISIGSNFKIIDVKTNPDPPTFINNEEIDLRAEDSWVNLFDGFDITGNYEMKMAIRAVKDNFYVLCKKEDTEVLKITYKYYDIDYEDRTERKYYYRADIYNDNQNVTVFTKMFDKPDDGQDIVLVLTHVNGYYSLNIKIGNKTTFDSYPYKLRDERSVVLCR